MTIRDLELDTDGDLKISDGDLQLVSDAVALQQSLKIRMQFFKGEWFLDLDAGIPFFESVLVKNPDPNVLQSVFRKALLETPGVLAISELTLSIDRSARRLTVSYRVSTDLGELQATEVI